MGQGKAASKEQGGVEVAVQIPGSPIARDNGI